MRVNSINQLRQLDNLIVRTIERNVSHTMLQKSGQRFRCLFQEANRNCTRRLRRQAAFREPRTCSMLGYQEEELRGNKCEEISDPEMSDSDLFQNLLKGSIRHYRLERRFVRKGGSQLWGRVDVSLLKNQEHGISLVVVTMKDITLLKTSERELERTRSELQQLAGHLIQAHEEERHRISRELHDDIGQRLALVAVDLDLLSFKLENAAHDEECEQICSLKSQMDDLTGDIHQLSRQLHSAQLQSVGVASAVEKLCKQASRQHKIQVECSMPPCDTRLSPELALCIFRIAQEALSNAVKHSKSARISVRMSSDGGFLRLDIQDYGVGFDPCSPAVGIGLISMRDRLRLVGGRLSVNSTAGNGTTISALVNISDRTNLRGVTRSSCRNRKRNSE